MSTRTETAPAPVTEVDDWDDEVLHRVGRRDMAFGQEFGVEVRALCGEWLYPSTPNGQADSPKAGVTSRLCPACERIYKRLPQH